MSLDMEQRTEGIRKQASELIDQTYQHGYKAGREEGFKNGFDEGASHPNINIIEEWIEQGRNEAWEAASKVIKMGEYSRKFEVFPECGDEKYPFDKVSSSEAIDRIRAYEQKKKEAEKIKVGDVIRRNDVEAVVTWCDGENWNGFLLGGEGVGEVGQVYSCRRCKGWKKNSQTL